MNADVAAVVVAEEPRAAAAEAALARVEALFAEVEAALSRFRPESELSRLNRAAGAAFAASPLIYDAVSLALRTARETGGIFDPTVLDALLAAGYDRSFEQVADGGTDSKLDDAPLPPRTAATFAWLDVQLDPGRREILVPAGVPGSASTWAASGRAGPSTSRGGSSRPSRATSSTPGATSSRRGRRRAARPGQSRLTIPDGRAPTSAS
jgi:thiamine biosynthesis lipoprotein